MFWEICALTYGKVNAHIVRRMYLETTSKIKWQYTRIGELHVSSNMHTHQVKVAYLLNSSGWSNCSLIIKQCVRTIQKEKETTIILWT